MSYDNDSRQFLLRGISPETIEKQLLHFREGFPYAQLAKPATVGDGIFAFSDERAHYYEEYFSAHKENLRIIKFVPASGAASRMFKHLFEYRDQLSGSLNDRKTAPSEDKNAAEYLIGNLEQIAFFDALEKRIRENGNNIRNLLQEGSVKAILDAILEPDGLNYAFLPKGLLLFHKYPAGARTAAEEHLVEAALYATDKDGISRIHFTISPEHRERFDALIREVQKSYEQQFTVRYEISFSVQEPSTDTIAVDENNLPFRNPDGSILFRPGGHGALLTNLNRLDCDLVFIKNIDNVVPDRLKPTTIQYKKITGGYLLFLKEQIFDFLRKAEQNLHTQDSVDEMMLFLKNHLFVDFPENFGKEDLPARVNHIVSMIDRPIRVCGMVRNEGEPGGGPFWVKNMDGGLSLQIIESSQVDTGDSTQKEIMNQATHFNPVDLVCYTRNYKGMKFNLNDFVDEDAGFISRKSSGGRILKAQELPGLWNGAMAHWLTAFVEVPLITFNPVKTVNDLLRNEHMGS